MTLVGIAVLTVEGLRANDALAAPASTYRRRAIRAVALTGGLMLGLSTFQAEFDFGVPQFQLVFEPMLLMLAAGLGLVLARVYAGRGAALGAVAFFIVIRGGLWRCWSARCWARRCRTSRSTSSRRWWSRRSPCGSRPTGRCASGSGRDWASAPSDSPPSGPGRRCGCRCPGRRRCSRKGPCSASPRRSPERRSAPGSARTSRSSGPNGRRPCARRRGLQRAGPGRPGRLRPAHPDRAGDQRQGGAARCRQWRHGARGRGDGRAATRRRGRRRRVVRRHRLAGRRPGGRPPEADGARPLPHHRADPSLTGAGRR